MPKSKRNRVVALTVTKKKTKELKKQVINDLQKAVEEYDNVFVFSYYNMRTSKLELVKKDWKESKFFFGKNKVVQVGLGKGPEDEYKDDIHKISHRLHGERGLLFTNNSKEQVLKYFKTFSSPDFARTGDTVTEAADIPAGKLEQFSHALEPRLRDLGMPTKLDKAVIILEKDYTICEEGDVLTSDQASLLKLFDIELGEFKFVMEAMWSEDSGYVDIVPEGKKSKKRQRAAEAPPPKKRARKEESEEEEEQDQDESEDEEELEEN
ncbi:mRNA turnover protein 4 -like protein [Halotydeus destructor]|nr:mRNA turnover protein 4 -like protein [Halotydeus destructor]